MPYAQNLGAAHTKSLESASCGHQLRLGALSLDREQRTTGSHYARGEAGQPLQRGNGPRGRDIRTYRAGYLLGSRPDHRHVDKFKLADALGQECRPPQHGLYQRDAHPRAKHGQDDPGQPGTRTYIDQFTAFRYKVGNHRTIQQVPFPQPGGFPGSNQPPDHPIGREEGSVPPYQLK